MDTIDMTKDEWEAMRKAVYMIADAKSIIDEINQAMKSDGRWRGQGDVAAITSNLHALTGDGAGNIGYFLKNL